ncbi:hypothetical protein F511_36315 [Dorcoceras hygrometricum]|uniref:Uncharacterized protein n=1 Tax=Dorcoceras hygrometricum TaxID=472368 RepID=A0A2Z7DGK2_9LAMI|nr:hypothetical protein F511_36315 [Dorcoceras hygrometricum]
MTSRLLKSSIILDDVTTAEIFNKLGRHPSSLLPEVQGTQSWFTGLEQERHGDQAQYVEVQNGSSADQVQGTRAVIECEAEYKHSDRVQIRSQVGSMRPQGRGRIYMLGYSFSLHKAKLVHPKKPAWRTAQMKSLLRYREQIRNQMVKNKPAGQVVQELIQEEGILSSKVMKFAR